jgi:putative mRNA 3-end processing factor
MRAASDPVILRPEGLYCPAGDFHIDPWLPVPRAVITHAHGDHARAGSGVYHCAAVGTALLRARLGPDAALRPLDYGEPIPFGAARVSLHPAGHILGSAQVRIETGGRVCVVSGDYKRDPDPTCAPFEPQACDVFITEATFGLPIYRWRPTPEVAREVLDWWDECRAEETTAVLFCYALGKAQRLLAELARLTDRRVLLHGAMAPLVDIYRTAGVPMLPTEVVVEQARGTRFGGELVLAPPSAAGSTWMRRFRRLSTGFASGWMQVRGNRRRRGHDRGFVVSDHADWPALLHTIAQTGARRILATHGNTDALVHVLQDAGYDAQALRTELGGEN